MADKQKISKEDIALFRASVKDARPLPNDRIPPRRKRITATPRKTLEDEARVRQDMLSLDFDPTEVELGDELLYARPGLQHALLRKLRRGQYAVRAELDLHGLTIPQARQALADFLAHCQGQANRPRCVRIVHGKGRGSPGRKPVLKSRLNGWLQQHSDVLAFCSAPRNDGGTGAVYVLLKTRR